MSLGLAEASERKDRNFAENSDLPKRSIADGIRLQRDSPGSHMWELEGLITAGDVDHVHLILDFRKTSIRKVLLLSKHHVPNRH